MAKSPQKSKPTNQTSQQEVHQSIYLLQEAIWKASSHSQSLTIFLKWLLTHYPTIQLRVYLKDLNWKDQELLTALDLSTFRGRVRILRSVSSTKAPDIKNFGGVFLDLTLGQVSMQIEILNQPEEVFWINMLAHDLNMRSEYEQKLAEAQQKAYVDQLTGLLNHSKLLLDLDQEVERADRSGNGPFSLLFLDLNHFKEINDSLGHETANKLLKALGPYLQSFIRKIDSLYRYGGDEFVILLIGASQPSAWQVAERIKSDLKRKLFNIEGQTFQVSASFGTATFPQDGKEPTTLLKKADTKMYQEKSKQRGNDARTQN